MNPFELLPELRQHIVSFLGPRDVISLTETCRRGLQLVEAYSQGELDRIEREHNLDGTWRFRVGMQTAQDAVALLSRQGENEQQQQVVPSDVSYRRMLRTAYRTPLYSLDTYSLDTASSRQLVGYFDLSMHPSGEQLLSGGHLGPLHEGPGIVQLWDLTTKQCIRECPGHGERVTNVDFSAGRMVSSSIEEDTLWIWSMDGVCQDTVNLHTRSIFAQAVTNDTVYAVDQTGPIYVLNSVSGTIRTTEQPWGDNACCPGLCVCGNYLLHLRSNHGIFIFDRDSMALQSRLMGDYEEMACTLGGQVALARFSGPIQLFHLQGGNLVARFAIPNAGPGPDGNTVLHMTESKVFVAESSLRTEESKITVYNASSGVKERSLSYPAVDRATNGRYWPLSMASNDRELFVGFASYDRAKVGHAIKAFLL